MKETEYWVLAEHYINYITVADFYETNNLFANPLIHHL